MSEAKERFLDLYHKYVTRDGADDLLKWLESSDFFTAPASTKFHGCHEGGLLQHSLNVYDCLVKCVDAAGLTDDIQADSVALVALLHDVCKVNFYKKGFRNVKNEETGQWERKEIYQIEEKFPCGHGEKSVIILQNFLRLTTDEIYAIRAHMGGFDTSVEGGDYFIGKIFEKSKLAFLLHLADMSATYLMEGE